MNYPSREEAEQHAAHLSLIDGFPWLVVDCGEISKPEYRVWREDTHSLQLRECPDCVPHHELLSRAYAGNILKIA